MDSDRDRWSDRGWDWVVLKRKICWTLFFQMLHSLICLTDGFEFNTNRCSWENICQFLVPTWFILTQNQLISPNSVTTLLHKVTKHNTLQNSYSYCDMGLQYLDLWESRIHNYYCEHEVVQCFIIPWLHNLY